MKLNTYWNWMLSIIRRMKKVLKNQIFIGNLSNCKYDINYQFQLKSTPQFPNQLFFLSFASENKSLNHQKFSNVDLLKKFFVIGNKISH